MLDAVQTALKPETGGTPPSKTPETEAKAEDPDAADKADAEKDAEPSDEEKAHWSDRTQRRFKRLTGDVKRLTADADALRPRAEAYDRIDTFVRQSNLSPTDVQQTLLIASQLKNDPGAAYQRLVPLMAQLENVLGLALPPELQQQVDQGLISEQNARAMSRLAAEARMSNARLQATSQQQQQGQQRQQVEQQVNAATSSVEAWETQRAQRDPDWSTKQPLVAEQVELAVIRERRDRQDPQWFPTPEEALKISQTAYDRVTERFSQFKPKPAATPRDPASGNTNRSRPAPKTMLEAIGQAVGAS